MSSMKRSHSFLLGTLVASVTWCVVLYLYIKLGSDLPNIRPLWSNWTAAEARVSDENAINAEKLAYDVKKDVVLPYENSVQSLFAQKKKYFNSEKLKKQLQPVFETADIDNELGVVRTMADKKRRDEGYKNFAFNVLVSDEIGMRRTVPDTRHKLCKREKYQINLPKVSIVICFFNEHLTTLLRSVHSILDRTPANLLQEIILVNDYSDMEGLQHDVSSYISNNFDDKVRLYKTKRRLGLIRARMFGARKAGGKVLIFLDSHIEVNQDWVQPLLNRVAENHTNVVVPIIDIINADTFKYTASPLVRGGFNWGLHFKWENLPKGKLKTDADFVSPIPSPTMAGGLFAIDREYFHHLGEYDNGMNIWGGENLEISFRIWMCGGRLELMPCSRVGHVFRKRRPYGAPNGEDTQTRNSLRVANVWMDDYKEFFYQTLPDAKNVPYGDITDRVRLRKELKCKSFDWYLQNIYPELILPGDSPAKSQDKLNAVEPQKFQPWYSRQRNYIAQFQMRLANTTLCASSEKDAKTKGSRVVLRTCLRSRTQTWYQTDKNELLLGALLCLDAGNSYPKLSKCHEMGESQEWVSKQDNGVILYNTAAGMCLGVKERAPLTLVTMELCTKDALVHWNLIYNNRRSKENNSAMVKAQQRFS